MRKYLFYLAALLTIQFVSSEGLYAQPAKIADKPLYRDSIYDGAADPVIVWNKAEKKWFMFYTNRRANIEKSNGVDWVHGTPIGIAESDDGGATWKYRCNAAINYGQEGYTFWAPDVIEHKGVYHMYLTVVPGTFTDWKHPRDIVHLTSKNLIDWSFEAVLKLASDKVIDASVFRTKDGWWYLYYNNEKDSKSIYYARSKDLYNWEDAGKAVADRAGEGPKVFYWQKKFFMVVDNWRGLGVYSSTDLKEWTRQPENILEHPGKGLDDGTNGLHADVVVKGDKAYIFYFTHPGRATGAGANDSYETRRSSIQVAELEYKNGVIVCDRDKPVAINLSKK